MELAKVGGGRPTTDTLVMLGSTAVSPSGLTGGVPKSSWATTLRRTISVPRSAGPGRWTAFGRSTCWGGCNTIDAVTPCSSDPAARAGGARRGVALLRASARVMPPRVGRIEVAYLSDISPVRPRSAAHRAGPGLHGSISPSPTPPADQSSVRSEGRTERHGGAAHDGDFDRRSGFGFNG